MGRKKRKRIPPRRLLRRKIILQQKVIAKEHSFLNNPSTFLLSRETSLSTTTIPTFDTLHPKVHKHLDEFGDIFPKEIDAIHPRRGPVTRAMARRLQEDWARYAGEGPRVLMSLTGDFGPMG